MKTNQNTLSYALIFLIVFFTQCGTSVSRYEPKGSDKTYLQETEQYSITTTPNSTKDYKMYKKDMANGASVIGDIDDGQSIQHNTEAYNYIEENKYKKVSDEPLSTFSIDVDNASYTNCRRYINSGSLPPKDAVRIEEFINYFNYQYPLPAKDETFSVFKEVAACPWDKEHLLLHVGIQGQRYSFDEMAPMNLVFLVDVSGSMSDENKLPLLKKSLTLLVDKMRKKDRVALVVYAGAAGLVLPSTTIENKRDIIDALDRLNSGGSTAGGEGIKLAYQIAMDNRIENGNNRIILCTDGDFNVGQSSEGELRRMVEERRDQGIYLTCLGFGMGNYKDSHMESMADHGNGNYFYIDNIQEAKKVLVDEIDGTLYTIAKDVKIQIEFNPAHVQGYRLIGYENRMLNKEDFNDDKKDAGELGAGHTVTAIYEIIPTGVQSNEMGTVDPLKYTTSNTPKKYGEELLTLKLRYKQPKDTVSKLIVHTVKNKKIKFEESTETLRFSAAVAGFGMMLRDSKFKGTLNYAEVQTMAQNALGKDSEGYRNEFVQLIKTSALLSGKN